MSRAKKPDPSLFDWAHVPVAEVPKGPPPVVVTPATDEDLEEFADAFPETFYVPVDEPAATAPLPVGVTPIRDSYAFCERNDGGDFWTGRTRGEHTHASVIYTRGELTELRRVIDAALAMEPKETGR